MENTELSVDAILKHAGLEFSETAKYPSNFPAYANDNSTFGHKKTKAIVKDKIKIEVNIPEEDRSHITTRIYPLYEKVLENCIINP